MTAIDKANELIVKVLIKFERITLIEAKKIVLMAVDEMILVLPFTDTNYSLNEYAIHLQKYLEQVKQEIEKL